MAEENMLDIDFEVLTNVKNNRTRRNLGAIAQTPFTANMTPTIRAQDKRSRNPR